MLTDFSEKLSDRHARAIARFTKDAVRMLSVHVTDYCNSKCDFCVVNSPMSCSPIETQALISRVQVNDGADFDIMNIHGGEPTISKALFPVLEAGQNMNIPEAHLQTNAIRLADRKLVDRLMKAGVSTFVISLHGHTAALQENITLTPKSFPKIIAGIRNCLEAGALVRTNAVICKDNIGYIEEVLALSCNLGVRWQNLSALHPSKHAMSKFQELVVHPREMRAVVPSVVKRITERFPDTTIEIEGFPFCHAPGLDQNHVDFELRKARLIYHEDVFTDYEDYMNDTQRQLLMECLMCSRAQECRGIYRAYATEFEGPLVWPNAYE